MYGLGLSYRDISKHIEDMYKIELSTGTISNITDKIITKVKEWQDRPLEPIYTFVWLDAIHYKIKDGGKYDTKAVYTVLGMDKDGKKDVLGLYIGESDGANFWLGVLYARTPFGHPTHHYLASTRINTSPAHASYK